MTLRDRANAFDGWYHIIDLAPGVATPGREVLIPNWEIVRKTRKHVDYKNKTVLDIGSFDGMWAFEAEELGAKTVVATDCYHTTRALQRFLFCHATRQSSVLPYYNVPPDKLYSRLDCYFGASREFFDIAQHLGVLYHLRDPLLSLSETRSCLRDGGTLLLETAILGPKEPQTPYVGFNFENRYYFDPTTWWLPSRACLLEMLASSGFQPHVESEAFLPQEENTQRYCIKCTAIDVPEELRNAFRNPGSERFKL